jgi:hypothetical protein
MTKLTLNQIGGDLRAVAKFTNDTLASYSKVAIALHQAACLNLYHTAQFGNCDQLNVFYAGLRVNDQTALRVWLGAHCSYVDLDSGEMRQWLKFSVKDGFRVVKGTLEKRENMFTVEADETVENDTRTVLMNLKPFYEKNVKDKDALTLEALVSILKKAGERVTKQAKEENIALPADILSLTSSIKNTTTKELAAIERIKE